MGVEVIVDIATRLPKVLRGVMETPSIDRAWEERTLEILKAEAYRRNSLSSYNTLDKVRASRAELEAEEARVVAGFSQALQENRGREFAEGYFNLQPQEEE